MAGAGIGNLARFSILEFLGVFGEFFNFAKF
jgi:hypothetical protein